MNPKITIIVPIYNVEQYLPRCIDSIKNQTLEDIEIILVDDGSTDNSGKIVDEYAKTDNRIIAIHKENGGQASARNVGLEIARGDYVGFIDSDDWVEIDMYQQMYERIVSTESDYCVCGRVSYSNDYKKEFELTLDNEILDFCDYCKVDYVTNRLFYRHTVSTCNKIYRRDLIECNNLRFKDVSLVGSEDSLFNYCFLLLANRVCSIDKSFYNNLGRVGSTTRSYKRGYMVRTARLIEAMDEFSFLVKSESSARRIIPLFVLFFFQWNVAQVKLFSEDLFNDLKWELKEAHRNGVFMKYVKILHSSRNLIQYWQRMGFRLKGRLLIKFELFLYTLKCFNILTKLIIRI